MENGMMVDIHVTLTLEENGILFVSLLEESNRLAESITICEQYENPEIAAYYKKRHETLESLRSKLR